MTEFTSTEADLQTLITTQSQQLTNANRPFLALIRVVRELEVEVAGLKPGTKAAEKKS